LRQIVITCVTLLLTLVVKDRFGWPGVGALLAVGFAVGFFWPIARRR
jgi:hypothetical protein